MAMIKLTPFSGMVPRTGRRLLDNTQAYLATNFKLQSGELRPLHRAKLIYTPASPKNGLQVSVFKARDGISDEVWFTWPVDVDCVRVPLATDVESRFCWTGDGPPKMVTYSAAISGGNHNYPLLASELMLGIPAPVTAPTITPSATGTGSSVTRFYRYTFFSQNGEESAPSPVSTIATGKLDDTWAISTIDAVPVNTTTGTAAYGSVTTFTTTAAAKHWLRVGDEIYFTVGAGIDTTLLHTVATVPSVTTFTVTGNYNTATTWIRKTNWNVSSMTKRLYRTTGTTGSWQLVNETGIAAATTTYNDTLTDALIAGDELISESWFPPPVDMHCLRVHPSGALVAIDGNMIRMSEPLQPHAWPPEYSLSSGYRGVGLASFGSTVVMATEGMPFVATGIEPASMSGEQINGMYPCLSKNSVLDIGNGVLYASKHGLVSISGQGISIFTEPWFTRDEWELRNPETMVCETASGRIYVLYTDDDSLQRVMIFDGPVLTEMTDADMQPSTLYADVSSGELYVTTELGISIWDSSDKTPIPGSWRSKEFVFPAPINIGAGKIEFDVAITPDERIAILAEIAAATAANALLIPPLQSLPVTINLATSTFTRPAHGFPDGAKIRFSTTGILPTSISSGVFYVRDVTTDTFKVSNSISYSAGVGDVVGAALNLSVESQVPPHQVYWLDADIGGAFSDDDYAEMEIDGCWLETPRDNPPSNIVTVSLFNGDRLLDSRNVDSTRVFRLTSKGGKFDNFNVQITSQCTVKEIRLAETADGMRVA